MTTGKTCLIKLGFFFINSLSWLLFAASCIYIRFFCKTCDVDSLLGFAFIEPFVLIVTAGVDILACEICRRRKIIPGRMDLFMLQLPLSSFLVYFYLSFFGFRIIDYVKRTGVEPNYYVSHLSMIAIVEIILFLVISAIYERRKAR